MKCLRHALADKFADLPNVLYEEHSSRVPHTLHNLTTSVMNEADVTGNSHAVQFVVHQDHRRKQLMAAAHHLVSNELEIGAGREYLVVLIVVIIIGVITAVSFAAAAVVGPAVVFVVTQ